jgi:polo-like kinase 1
MSEIKIHRSLHHSGVVGFEHFFEDNDNVYILLELCGNQTLNELLRRRKRLTELEVLCYMNQLIDGLKYLHSHRVIHRDLKLGNLFLNDKMELKIGDFGLATKLEFDGDRKRTVCGTPNYIAPEILEGKQGHSYEVDIWSLGVIIYTLLIGKPPYETTDVKATYKRIKMNQYNFPESALVSENAKNLIAKILILDPTKRIKLDEILAHPFFTTYPSVPKLLPNSTLACPPSASYMKQYTGNANAPSLNPSAMPMKLESTTSAIIGSRIIAPLPNFNNTEKISLEPKCDKPKEPQKEKKPVSKSEEWVWVKKWVDYSSKYGIGYLLTTGATGVFYNDSTKVILSKDEK